MGRLRYQPKFFGPRQADDDDSDRYRSGRHSVNLGDCLHFTCAKYFAMPILAKVDEFRQTDLTTVSRADTLLSSAK